MPDPVVSPIGEDDPEHEALLADAVGLALLVVLETLTPAERLAFVLHDLFAVPFDEIAPLVERTPAATRQLASRARRQVRGAPAPDPDLARQRQVVDAFLTAAREGDFDRLVATLHPDVVLRADAGPRRPELTRRIRGAEEVAGQAIMFARSGAGQGRAALVNGVDGTVTLRDGVAVAVAGFTVSDGRIAAIDILADPERLARLDLTGLGKRHGGGEV